MADSGGPATLRKLRQKHKVEERFLKNRIKTLSKNKKLSKEEIRQQSDELEQELRERQEREVREFMEAEAAGGGKKVEEESERGESDAAAAAAAAATTTASTAAESPAEAAPEAASVAADSSDRTTASKKGKTRAQRRREKRFEEARKREKELEEARANAPDPRQEEVDALNAALRLMRMEIKPVAADGNCLFRAVENQLQLVDKLEDGQDHKTLRRAAARFIEEHPDEFAPFLPLDEAVPGGDSVHDSVRAYCEKLATTSMWGGQPEVRALAEFLGLPIVIHQVGTPATTMGPEDGNPVLHISFHRHYYALGEHYNSVEPMLS